MRSGDPLEDSRGSIGGVQVQTIPNQAHSSALIDFIGKIGHMRFYKQNRHYYSLCRQNRSYIEHMVPI